ncbi:MAG: transketolase [Lachnospiraceae bacterium]|nr:transketolase [Lachnospiraceae bacterium]
MEILKRVHAKNLVKWAKKKPDVLVLSADLTSSCEADAFRDTYPDRFFSMGIAEQNMLGFAGGLAREGFVPYVHTFAVFIYRRALDQIAMSVAYPNLPVKMIGFLPGVTTPGGATHQAIEDTAIMRSLPNMTVLEVGDATEVENVLDVAYKIPGPVYVRMLRGELPRIFDTPMEFKKARKLSSGKDLVIVSAGICTEEVLRTTKILKKSGIEASVYHISTLKPFDYPELMKDIKNSKYGVITMENHSIIGGLGSCVAECMAEEGIGKKLYRIGINDSFLHGASRPYLMKEYGIDAPALLATVEKAVGKKIKYSEDDLGEVFIPALHSDAKAEAL